MLLILTMFHTTQDDLIHISKDDHDPMSNHRKPLNFDVSHSTINAHLHTFFKRTIHLWNYLPYDNKLGS